MSDLILVKQHPTEISEADKAAARALIFGTVDGLGEDGKKAWRRFWNMLWKLEPGEMVDIKLHKERIGLNHRRHMLFEQRVFEGQERFPTFKDFRVWLKVGAGFCDWYAGPRGGVIPVPKSIAYHELEEMAMQQLHVDMVAFLRTEHAVKTLWPKLSLLDRDAALESILGELNE